MSASSPGIEPAVLPGEILAGKYKIERILGRGGMGVVLAARNIELDERVAIKILAREHTADVAGRFVREARAAASIRSEHVVRIFDVGRDDAKVPYIVMEYLEGQDLSAVLDAGGSVPPELAVHWVLEACEALAEAHAQGIVHRDLKPANLFLARRADGSTRIKLLDFGIAKLPDGVGLTQTAHFLGSPVYMAPEQLASTRDVDARADIWALGAVLYELITGIPPFVAESVLELAVKVRDDTQRPAVELRPDMPEGLSKIIDCCLAKRRDERWSGVAALGRALERHAPQEAKALVGRIERISGGGDAQATLDAGGSRSAFANAPTVDSQNSSRQATFDALSASTGFLPQARLRRRRWLGVAIVSLLGLIGGASAVLASGSEHPEAAGSVSAGAEQAPSAAPQRPEPPVMARSAPESPLTAQNPVVDAAVETDQEPKRALPLRASSRSRASRPAAERSAAIALSEPTPAPETPAAAPPTPSAPRPPAAPASDTTARKRPIDRSSPW